jgi:putative tricarboxylic transport membrane protein
MGSLNKDTAAALLILAATGAFFWESFNIPELGYASMGSEVWPRVILAPLFVLGVIYLIQSLRRAPSTAGTSPGFVAGVVKYRNPIMCFVLFFVFLLTVEYLGMLIAGVALTFGLLTALGNRAPKDLVMHVVISVAAVGIVWSLFTFVLRVYLPEGELLRVY